MSSLIILDKSFVGKKPPEEINENAKFKESKVLIENRFSIIKITKVKYTKIRLTDLLYFNKPLTIRRTADLCTATSTGNSSFF